MQGYHRKEHFWNVVIWPILWPWLLAQLALVGLCLIVGLVIWGMNPEQASWGTVVTLMAALLLGSSLNVGAVVVLVRARARRFESTFDQVLGELEQHTSTLCERSGLATVAPMEAQEVKTQRPHARVSHVIVQLAQLGRYLATLAPSLDKSPAANSAQQTLLDDLAHKQQQLDQLLQGRERAREESRLKSSYLHLLQRETNALFECLGDLRAAPDAREADLKECRERLADIRALLANVAEEMPEMSTMASPAHPRRVLVVDDGPVNLMLAQQVLEKHGLEVDTVSSGEDALALQQTHAFDLVFMDIFMPEMDGLETSRRWRAYEKTYGKASAILVALTANADTAGRERCLQAGMNDLIAKPYQPESLINKVAAWFPDDVAEASPL
ncbi:response regulator [Halomonas llamarensis]|uniref:Response regulator n=1 Tax=Halomonas llamarensis TaxID=2945104 RepID=A0ABT0SQ91_9GAMM|nr:response regulator [Halomonas llamarensis]MCL7929743.1 response regulator [Halomonas llamarensis]